MRTYKLDEVQDKLIGRVGTPERDLFEYELHRHQFATNANKVKKNE